MVRLIKRYESRKLYDTEESRYVSLDEIATFVREGQNVQVIDNGSAEDVTTQTLAQIILEEGKAGRSALPAELMHDLVRAGERALSSGLGQVQTGVDRLLQASIDRVGPLRRAREEMGVLRSRLEDLEASLRGLDSKEPKVAKSAAPRVRKTAQSAKKKASTTRTAPATRTTRTTRKVAKKPVKRVAKKTTRKVTSK